MSKIKNAPTIVNGDTVIGFTSTQKAQELGWVDLPSLSSWYQEDPDKNHLGLIELFSSQADYRMPTYKKFCEKNNYLTKNGSLRYTAEIIYQYIIKIQMVQKDLYQQTIYLMSLMYLQNQQIKMESKIWV